MLNKLGNQICIYASAAAMTISGCGTQNEDVQNELRQLRAEVAELKAVQEQKKELSPREEEQHKSIDENLAIAQRELGMDTKEINQEHANLLKSMERSQDEGSDLDDVTKLKAAHDKFTREIAAIDQGQHEVLTQNLTLMKARNACLHIMNAFTDVANIESKPLQPFREQCLTGVKPDLKLARELLSEKQILNSDGTKYDDQKVKSAVNYLDNIIRIIDENGWSNEAEMRKSLMVLKKGTSINNPDQKGESKFLNQLGMVNPQISPLLETIDDMISKSSIGRDVVN